MLICLYYAWFYIHLCSQDKKNPVYLFPALLHNWPMETTHFSHVLSKSIGLFQYCGNNPKTFCFKLFNSSQGNAGLSRYPITVHLFSTFSPKYDSCASFWAKVGILLSTRYTRYFSMMLSGLDNWLRWIYEELKYTFFDGLIEIQCGVWLTGWYIYEVAWLMGWPGGRSVCDNKDETAGGLVCDDKDG